MAPTIAEIPQPQYFHLFTRASDPNYPSLTSLFAVIIDRARNLTQSSSNALARSLSGRNAYRSAAAISKLSTVKRQQQILVIPTTYANIKSSPKPGAVAGITLGAVFGFLLALTIMILIFRSLYGGSEVVEEEIITKRSRRSHTKKQSSSSSSSHGPPIPVPIPIPPEVVVESRRSSRRQSHVSRRTSRMSRRSPEQVIVEEELSSVHSARRGPEEVIVVEEESTVHSAEPEHVVVEEEEEDIVEVIEEHSPEPPPRRRSSAATRRSGAFRTVDPAEFGGGDAPSRRISRQTNRK